MRASPSAAGLRSGSLWLPEGFLPESIRRRPFYTFLLKVASRCNLDCDYCYIYNTPDQSWRDRPRYLEGDLPEVIARRIAEHARTHDLPEVQVIFHGGEPLLAGADRLDRLVRTLRETVPCRVTFGVQTNGTLLTEPLLELFAEIDAKIGISLDGNRAANDLHRLYPSGRSSHEDVVRGLSLLRSRPEWSRLFAGFLVVVDLRNDPHALYDTAIRLGTPSIDVVLPDCHHDSPPPRPASPAGPYAYGAWMAALFDRWYSDQCHFDIRYFDEILALMLGGPSHLETIGAESVDLIVVESDGDIEAVDTLKAIGREATHLVLNVRRDAFDRALEHPAVYSRMSGFDALCSTCRSCPELKNCGGGYLPHRYGRGNGFLNPSIYCEDLKYLFARIRSRIAPDLSSARRG